jgi:hypothetical protein
MTGVTDLEGICVDIGCTAAQTISACEQSLHTDPNGWIERLERQEKGSGPIGIRCGGSQGLQCYTDQPIQWPNSSYAYGARVADNLLVPAADR